MVAKKAVRPAAKGVSTPRAKKDRVGSMDLVVHDDLTRYARKTLIDIPYILSHEIEVRSLTDPRVPGYHLILVDGRAGRSRSYELGEDNTKSHKFAKANIRRVASTFTGEWGLNEKLRKKS